MSERLAGVVGILVALLAAAVLLIVIEVARGASNNDIPKIADPCQPRQSTESADPIQRLVLSGLDQAACKVGTSREKLVLSLSGGATGGGLQLNKAQVATTIRNGLLSAVHSLANQGILPPFIVTPLEALIQEAPIDKLVQGNLGNLLG